MRRWAEVSSAKLHSYLLDSAVSSSEKDKNVDIAIKVTSYSNLGTYAQKYKIKKEKLVPKNGSNYVWKFIKGY